ncbi:hypothetical protein [Gorillibacterium sp. CAU 1737]|uniref:hypothetical protein n=1 Tax=Gorillibacterium sp. CAU 1737 TaxID=3140362 RepID=UPI003261CCAE
MNEMLRHASESWLPYVPLGAMAVYILVKALKLRRRERSTPSVEQMDEDLLIRLNAGRAYDER